MSKLTKSQKRQFGPRAISGYGPGAVITATVRHDDECSNGHNTFSITADVVTPASRRRNDIEAGGCLHEDIARVFPELAPFIKWHLTSTDEPLHYVENTMYWLGYCGWTDGKPGSPPNLEHARSAAIWPDMPESFVAPSYIDFSQKRNYQCIGSDIEAQLRARLPQLKADFRAAVESLGMEY